MSNETAKVVENVQYSLKSEYANNVDSMNSMSSYPAWNAAADKQARYPNAKLEGARVRKQIMGRGQ